MATVYDQIASNTRKTYLLISSFLILIIGIGWVLSYLFNAPYLLVAAVLFSVLMSFFSYWYSDKIVLKISRARPLKKEEYPEIYRLVENLTITAGMPMPKIYIINEDQPNAFATGRDEKHAAVALTKGLIERLEKSEIEGVIAHELSHIKNRDVLLSTVVVVLVGIIVLISDWVIRLTFWGGLRRNRDTERSSLGALLLLLGFLFIIISPILARLIQFAVSRKREFLADASAVLLTRYPEGLIRALQKISTYPYSARIANNATAHLFIANPFRGEKNKSWLVKLFSTHPPIEERIKALEKMGNS